MLILRMSEKSSILFYSECIADKVTDMKIFERIKRIPTWEECRERCNNHAECEHFRFKVGIHGS